jgi:hypothetical protein
MKKLGFVLLFAIATLPHTGSATANHRATRARAQLQLGKARTTTASTPNEVLSTITSPESATTELALYQPEWRMSLVDSRLRQGNIRKEFPRLIDTRPPERMQVLHLLTPSPCTYGCQEEVVLTLNAKGDAPGTAPGAMRLVTPTFAHPIAKLGELAKLGFDGTRSATSVRSRFVLGPRSIADALGSPGHLSGGVKSGVMRYGRTNCLTSGACPLATGGGSSERSRWLDPTRDTALPVSPAPLLRKASERLETYSPRASGPESRPTSLTDIPLLQSSVVVVRF